MRDRDRPGDRRRRAAARSTERPRPGAPRRPRGRRGLAEDAAATRCRSPTRSRPTPPRDLPDAGGRRDDRAAALAGRRPLHLPRLPRVRAATDDGDGDDRLRAVPGSGLGILRADQAQSGDAGRLPRGGQRAGPASGSCCVLTKANCRSTVHRPAYLDYVGVKTFDERRRGRWASAASSACSPRPPTTRASSASRCCGARPPRSSARSGFTQQQPLRQGPAADPRDLPARRAVPDRRSTTSPPPSLQRAAPAGAPPAAAVPAPRRLRPVHVLPGLPAARPLHDRRAAAHGGDPARGVRRRQHRLHGAGVRVGAGPAALRRPRRRRATRCPTSTRPRSRRGWSRRPGPGTTTSPTRCATSCGVEQGARLAERLRRRVPRGVQGGLPGRRRGVRPAAARGARRPTATSTCTSTTPAGAAPGERRFKIFRGGEPVSLSAGAAACCSEMGVEVIDERPYEIQRPDGPRAWIYDFGLRYEPSGELPGDDARDLFQDAFAAVWARRGRERRLQRARAAGRAHLAAGDGAARVRQVPAAGRLDVQPGLHRGVPDLATSTSRGCWSRCSRRGSTRPGRAGGAARRSSSTGWSRRSAARWTRWRASTRTASCAPSSALIRATLRTNYFQVDADGEPEAVRRVQARPAARCPTCPAPRPRFEIWVYSPAGRGRAPALRPGRPRRAALVRPARGLPHRDPRPGQGADGEERRHRAGRRQGRLRRQAAARPTRPTARRWLAEGIACYRTFICGLLDVTDNLVTVDGRQQVVPPPHVVRHDGDDTYLVVAADKGTATFSDIANEVSLRLRLLAR